MKKKVVMIGFDGATFDLITPFVKKGILPNFSTILKEGSSAPLISVIPPVSAPAWVSIATGKNPGKHNIYGFTDRNGRMINATFRKSKALWNFMDDYGKKSLIMNVPVTYPPEKINGKIIPGILDPHERGHHGRFQIDRDSLIEKENVLERMSTLEMYKTEKALNLMSKEKWDFAFIVHNLSDFVPTIYWKYMDKTHPQHLDKTEQLEKAIENTYKILDHILGKFLSAVGSETDVIVLSDHGIGPSHRVLNINEWLRREGFLVIKSPVTFEKVLSPVKIAKFVESNHFIKKIILNAPLSLQKLAYSSVIARSKDILSRMEKKSSRAYASSHAHFASIWLLHKNGQIVSRLEDGLKALKDPDTGETIIKRVYRRDELFHGPWTHNAPNLVVEALPEYSFRSQRLGNLFSVPLQSGDHRMNGIFIAYGSDIRKKKLEQISIFDVCPTVLALFDLPIPADMDGRPLKEILKRDIQAAEKPPVTSQKIDAEQAYTLEEEEKIKERLSSLGYFD